MVPRDHTRNTAYRENILNERQRTQYLEAMGIHTFVPRRVLPGAAAPKQAALPQVPAPAQSNPAQQSAATVVPPKAGATPAPSTPRAASGMVSGIVGELQERVKRPAGAGEQRSSPAKRVLAALDDKATEQTVHFALSLWRVSPSLLVIDSHQSKQALPTGTLLNNILFAKGLRASLARPEVLTWPMAGGSGGWLEAREMVHAFLQARLERQPVTSLWLMGEASYRAVDANDEDYQQCIGQLHDLTSFNCVATVLPGLADMLRNPSLKVPAWQAIKAQKID